MDFCIITPIEGLERFATLSRKHLVLPQISDLRYQKFYRERRDKGDCLILDNGAYEGTCVSNGYLIDMIHYYTPNIVVLPDKYLADAEENFDLAMAFLDKVSKYIKEDYVDSRTNWMFCPQSTPGKVIEFWLSVYRALANPLITHLGLPRNMVTDIFKDPLARVESARTLKSTHPKVHLHALGMADGDYEELWALKKVGVESIDSSAPVWRGWNGFDLDDPDWDGLEVDFNAKPPRMATDLLIRSNLRKCGVKV